MSTNEGETGEAERERQDIENEHKRKGVTLPVWTPSVPARKTLVLDIDGIFNSFPLCSPFILLCFIVLFILLCFIVSLFILFYFMYFYFV
jgi:hypothetical protein